MTGEIIPVIWKQIKAAALMAQWHILMDSKRTLHVIRHLENVKVWAGTKKNISLTEEDQV